MKVLRAVSLAILLVFGAPLSGSGQGNAPDIRYHVAARVDDAAGVVVGTVHIRYRHPVAPPLDSLVLRVRSSRSALRGAARDSVDPESGFYILDAVSVAGSAVTLGPLAGADGTLLRLRLPHPLAPGDTVLLRLTWRMRPPAAGARIERRARRLQLASWYPVVLDVTAGTAVLAPAFGTHRVEIDVADDQVVAGTGLPVCGDPGWQRALVRRESDDPIIKVFYEQPRDPAGASGECGHAEPGRRRIAFYAEGVGEVVLAMSPTFRYEEGDINERYVRAFYEAGGERVWGSGLTTRRMETALAWTDEILQLGQDFPWPQTTVVEALPGSAQAAPMMLFAESSTQSALLSLLALMVTEHLVGGGDRDFSRGTAAFHAAWFFETHGRLGDYARLERQVLDWDLDGRAGGEEPLRVQAPSSACRTTSCRRAEFMFHQLRWWADNDSLVRALYARTVRDYLLQPTPRGTFAGISREVIRPDPGRLYADVIRGARYDDAVVAAQRTRLADGWQSSVTVERRAEGVFPRTLWVIAETDTVAVRDTTMRSTATLEIRTRSRPLRVVLDPLAESHDWNMLNNQWGFARRAAWHPLLWLPGRGHAPVDNYLDTYLSRRSARDRLTRGWAPGAWYNDVGGWMFGVRTREDYLGRFELNESWLALSERAEGGQRVHGSIRLANPVWWFNPRWTKSLELTALEGRAAARFGLAYHLPTPVSDSIVRAVGAVVRWLTVTDHAWLDPRQYDDVATAELSATFAEARVSDRSRWSFDGSAAGGYAWGGTFDAATYARFTITGAARLDLMPRLGLGARLFAGSVLADDRVPRQRLLFWSHPDPWEQLRQPLVRSRGALLTRTGFHYHDPGGIGVRGIAPDVASRRALGVSIEADATLLHRPDNPLLHRAVIAAFTDAGMGDEDARDGASRGGLADAGVGVRAEHRAGRTRFTTRLDFPLWVSWPARAQDAGSGRPFALRWAFSLAPAF